MSKLHHKHDWAFTVAFVALCCQWYAVKMALNCHVMKMRLCISWSYKTRRHQTVNQTGRDPTNSINFSIAWSIHRSMESVFLGGFLPYILQTIYMTLSVNTKIMSYLKYSTKQKLLFHSSSLKHTTEKKVILILLEVIVWPSFDSWTNPIH